MWTDYCSAMSGRILIVEDDERLALLLSELLEQSGYQVSVESRGDLAAERILGEEPDLVLLDIALPGRDGVTVCRDIRARYGGWILMLTARREEIDEVIGLEAGADDYVAKPVAPRRLLARVRALLRRSRAPTDGAPVSSGPLTVDPARRVVELHGEPVPLTTAEFDLLWLLARRVGQVVSREEIFQELRGFDYDGLDRSVDIRISRLRRCLGDDSKDPSWIKTVRGSGYQLVKRA